MEFIANDPIAIPHEYERKQDIEIAGLISAIFAWGQRKTIINKSRDFLDRMANQPYDFVRSFDEIDLKEFASFKHRTFQFDDSLSLLYFLRHIYSAYHDLEDFFIDTTDKTVYEGLLHLDNTYRSLSSTARRSYKHISSPARNSACKRLNMFLRWMVRSDENGVDFGIWKNISPSQLIIPLDVHVLRSANKLKLIKSKKADWKTAIQLTEILQKYDHIDPVKFDFALFHYSLIDGGRHAPAYPI